MKWEPVMCPECEGTGQMWGSVEPEDAPFWCGNCYGTGVIQPEPDEDER